MNTYQSLEHLHHLLQEIQHHAHKDDFQEAFGIIEDLREPYLVMLAEVEKQLYEKPFYVWANEMCDNKTDNFLEAYQWYQELLNRGAENVNIVDADFEIIIGVCGGHFYPLNKQTELYMR